MLVHELHMETYADREPPLKRVPFDHWCERSFGSSFDPSLWFIAEAQGHPAGLCLCQPRWDADHGRAWISVLGVRSPWRCRGLGLALLLHSFGDLHRRGFTDVSLDVRGDGSDATRRLCERAGMSISRRFDLYARYLVPLASD